MTRSLTILIVFSFILAGLAGCSSDKIEPGFSTNDERVSQPGFDHIEPVETRRVVPVYEAPGTIRPLTESIIESQASAKITNVFCAPGTRVKKDQVLIELDARSLEARLKQAKEGSSIAKKQVVKAQKSINAASARLNQTQSAYARSKKLFDSAIISSQQLEQDQSAYLQAKADLEKTQQTEEAALAGVRQAQEVVKEATIAVEYAKITSPADGIVVQKMADPGDLAVPGKPLLIIQTSGALRLEAHVREGLINRIEKNNTYDIRIETIQKTVESVVQEIVPYADPNTRTFLIKATLPDVDGLFPGMFGRLLIPLDPQDTILIPKQAVIQIGQLELVKIKKNDQWQSVYIKTGKIFDDQIEVLSGLSGSETIGY
jgi:HlyD family secretion protein